MLTLRKLSSGLFVICILCLVVILLYNNSQKNSFSQHFFVECLSEKDYVLNISDIGYSDKLPIDIKIRFSLDEKGLVKQDTVDIVYSKTDTEDYASIVAYVDSINLKEVYCSLMVENVNVYTNEGKFIAREPFEYKLVSRFNIKSLEVLSLDIDPKDK